MTDAPKRIWLRGNPPSNPTGQPGEGYDEYIRADIHKELVEVLRSIAENCSGVLPGVENQEIALETAASIARAALAKAEDQP